MIYAYVAVALFMSVSLVGMDIHGDLSVIGRSSPWRRNRDEQVI